MHVRRDRVLAPFIPTATMADIAFLLIIFFMVTTAYSIDRTPMELPHTEVQQSTEKGAAVISITRDGTLRFSPGEQDTEVVPDIVALGDAVRVVTAGNALHQFIIKADREVPYRVIDEVLEQLRQAGAENVALLSRAEEAS